MAKFKTHTTTKSDALKAYIASKEVCRIISNYGYDAYFVGGGVRDLLMNKTPKDFDIATNMPILTVSELFPTTGNNIINHRFFVHTFRHYSGTIIDVAQYRDDSSMLSRMGDVPIVGTLETDSKRRDFTINSIYFNPLTGDYFDLLGGRNDLRNRQIVPTDDPAIIFEQDPVRLVRGLRFSLSFGFELMYDFDQHKHLLVGDQTETIKSRVMQEFHKISKLPQIAAKGITAKKLYNYYL